MTDLEDVASLQFACHFVLMTSLPSASVSTRRGVTGPVAAAGRAAESVTSASVDEFAAPWQRVMAD